MNAGVLTDRCPMCGWSGTVQLVTGADEHSIEGWWCPECLDFVCVAAPTDEVPFLDAVWRVTPTGFLVIGLLSLLVIVLGAMRGALS
jgi:hypothetical protein